MKKMIAANWKMFKTPVQTREFFKKWKAHSDEVSNDLVFFPPALCAEAAAESLRGSAIKWGSQNSHFQAQGAFTGEISAQTVKEMGGEFVLLGHSERRQFFGETDELIAKKIQFVLSLGLTPMLCIGESLSEREKSRTNEVLSKQLKICLSAKDGSQNLVVAYEPIWAIGTGKVATAEQVAEAHQHINKELVALGLSTVKVLYGGSVKADNCNHLIGLPHVDGFLVGGASLEVETFLPIAKAN